ncbi:TerB family tellurite resistance protein [Amaricoccus tamworthensis]|uniref:tellurite resistance TerB family protein n=1 Tax=Amaricoccus tamworthensis TaxID=57002 RepID=UPI003C7E0D29
MIADLLRRLAGTPTEDTLDPHDARLALAALMVRIARTDHTYTEAERERISRVLSDYYSLGAQEVEDLRREAEQTEAEAPDTVRFTRLIKAAVPYEDREGIVEALWRVAAADGINDEEHGLLRLVANLVGVSDKNSALARQRALARDD